ncbi:MAG: DUF6036 family nucleotidyltransferase [Saprospiraceae bacterium]
MLTLPPDFNDFIQLLNSYQVEYLLIGGYAVALHGHVRFTQDMDVWVCTNPENAKKVVHVLKDFGLTQADELLDILQKENRVVGMGVPPIKIEVVTTISGVAFEECYQNRRVVDIDGLSINYLSLDDLRKNKLASGRPKDLADLDSLPEEE